MGYYGFAVTNYQSFGGDRGDWVYNRIVIVKCDNIIPEENQDKHLVEHLLEEKEYIVSLAIKGLRQVIKNGYKYNVPDSCKLLNKDFKVDNHSFLAFRKECVIERPTLGSIEDDCTTAKFYRVYEAWCNDNNNGYKETKREINKLLDEMGEGEKKKTNGGNTYYKAITLSNEAKADYKSVYSPYTDHDFPDTDANTPDSDELGLNNTDDVIDFSLSNTDFDVPDIT